MIALRQAAMVDPEFGTRLRAMVAANNDHLRDHLAFLPAAGYALPGDLDLVCSAITALLDQFAWTWLAGSGDGTGRTVTDDEAIDLLTEFGYRGLAGGGPH